MPLQERALHDAAVRHPRLRHLYRVVDQVEQHVQPGERGVSGQAKGLPRARQTHLLTRYGSFAAEPMSDGALNPSGTGSSK